MHRRARRPMMCDEPLAADHWKELPERAIPFFAGCGDLIGFRSSCGFPPPPCFPIECNCHRKCNKTGDNPGIWPYHNHGYGNDSNHGYGNGSSAAQTSF